MILTVHGAPTYCYTGGKPFDAAKPSVVFIHGVLNDHSVWILQSRYLAHHGFNVLAVDLPGHCRSGGEAPASVEEAAAHLKERVTHLVLVGTAFPMRVSPALIEASMNDPMKALTMVNVFSRSTLCAPPSALGPGTWVFGAGMALGRRVLASNAAVNVFHRGFVACDRYANGDAAITQITAPVLFLLGGVDQMTPPKAAQGLITKAREAGKTVQVVTLPVGHHQMTETPDATLAALHGFLAP